MVLGEARAREGMDAHALIVCIDFCGRLRMPFNDKRFPELIQELYRIVDDLEKMFPGRPFTPDGHMVGSLAECFAEYKYGLKLHACSYPGHDAHTDDCKVEIKATQGKSVSLRSCPEKLLVFQLLRDGSLRKSIMVRVLRCGRWQRPSLDQVTVSIKSVLHSCES